MDKSRFACVQWFGVSMLGPMCHIFFHIIAIVFLKRICNPSLYCTFLMFLSILPVFLILRLRFFLPPTPLPSKSLTNENVCHSCKIEKQKRMKHCRFCDVCVLRFDHHCPLFGSCVGLHNCRSFYVLAIVDTIATISVTIHLFQMNKHNDFGVILLNIIAMLCFLILQAPMLFFHTFLICKNLTTNEFLNAKKYDWIHGSPWKDIRSEFDRGSWKENCFTFWKLEYSKEGWSFENETDWMTL